MGSLWVILILFGLWFFLLRTKATPLDSMAGFEAILSGGQPVVAEFFSNT